MEGSIKVPISVANNAFTLVNPAFVVSGPGADGMLQIDLADDHLVYPTMTVSGDMVGADVKDGLLNPRFEFPDYVPHRTIMGRLKMSPQGARQFAALLMSHADIVESATSAPSTTP